MKELCVTCHDEQAKKIASAKVQHPGAQGDCTDCHSPHGGKTPGFIRPDPVTACLTCHSDQAELQKKGHLHQPAYRAGLRDLPRAAWRRKRETTARQEREPVVPGVPRSGRGSRQAGKRAPGGDLRWQGETARELLPQGDSPAVEVRPRAPDQRHPVQDVVDPATTKVVTAISCATCHQPHASAKAGLLVKDQAEQHGFLQDVPCQWPGFEVCTRRGSVA